MKGEHEVGSSVKRNNTKGFLPVLKRLDVFEPPDVYLFFRSCNAMVYVTAVYLYEKRNCIFRKSKFLLKN